MTWKGVGGGGMVNGFVRRLYSSKGRNECSNVYEEYGHAEGLPDL